MVVSLFSGESVDSLGTHGMCVLCVLHIEVCSMPGLVICAGVLHIYIHIYI